MDTAQNQLVSVTAGDISRNFGHWQKRAMSAPVVVTNHGRPRVILVSADLYAVLSGSSGDLGQAEPSIGAAHAAILRHSTEAFLALDYDLRVTEANGALEGVIGMNLEGLKGLYWHEVFPGAAQAIIGEHCERVIRAGDTSEFQASASSDGARPCTMRAFPYQDGVAILILNRTEERDLRQKLDEEMAFRKAIASLSRIATARLNIRGVIVSADQNFATMTGFVTSELLGFRLTDLARPNQRHDLGDAIELVLRGGAPQVLPATLLVKNGEHLNIEFAVAAILCDGAADGLVAAVHLQGADATA